MSNSRYFQHHHALLTALYDFCSQQLPFSEERASDTDRECLKLLQQLSEATAADDQFQESGQALISRLIGNNPHITPSISRDLLWFFGGDCLHFMGDDELALYQQLDELWHQQADAGIAYSEAKARIFQLH
jgi:hypothetical protein